jgi:hypothetical protein
MKKLVLALVLFTSLLSVARVSRPTVYIERQNGFETYLAAAFDKKGVPADVVTEETKATYLLKAAPVEIQKDSIGGKID